MSDFVPRDSSDRFEALAGEVAALKWAPHRAHKALLAGVTSLISSPGPSSVLHLSAFFAEPGCLLYGEARGTFYGAVHQNRSDLVALLERVYRVHLQKRDSVIERSIHAKTEERSWGVASLFELVSPEEWEAPENWYVRKLARKASVKDILYLWMRRSDDDLLAVCLRRDEPFHPHEKRILYGVGSALAILPPTDFVARLGVLTPREQDALTLLTSGKLIKQCVAEMRVSRTRFTQYQKALEKKLRFKTDSDRADERRALLIRFLSDNSLDTVRSLRSRYDIADGYFHSEDLR